MRRILLFIGISSAGVASFAAVDNIYFTEYLGFDLVTLGLLVGAFNLSVALSELPFSVAFDRFSNRTVLISGHLIRLLAFTLLLTGSSKLQILSAEVFAGMAVAAMSGTSDALVVNQLETVSREAAAAAVARIKLVQTLSALAAGVAGVLIFSGFPRGIWALSLVLFAFSLLVVRAIPDTRSSPAEPFGDFIRLALFALKRHRTILLVLVNAAALPPFILWQLKLGQSSLWLIAIGYVSLCIGGAAAPLIYKIVHLSPAHLLPVAVINMVAAIAFALAAGRALMILIFTIHVMSHGLLIIITQGLFHEGLSNSIRATTLSAVSLMDSALVAVLAPTVTALASWVGIGTSIALSGVIYGCVAIVGSRLDKAQ